MSLFRYGSLCFWKQSLPVDCPCWWRWMARDQIISAFPVLGLQACGTVLANFHGFWGWNSCPHVCMASPSDLVNSTVLKYSLLLITNLLIFIFNQLTGHQASFFFKTNIAFVSLPSSSLSTSPVRSSHTSSLLDTFMSLWPSLPPSSFSTFYSPLLCLDTHYYEYMHIHLTAVLFPMTCHFEQFCNFETSGLSLCYFQNI